MVWKPKEGELPDIAKVGALEGDCFDVTLTNGHTILLELGGRVGEPEFQNLIAHKNFDKPKTDGKRLYWDGGLSFTVADILNMLASK